MSVKLRPIDPSEFAAFANTAIATYCGEHVRARQVDPADGLAWAKAEFARLLPGGLGTPGNHLLIAYAAELGRRVGEIWMAERSAGGRRLAMILSVVIDEDVRRRGFGKAALMEAERFARGLGYESLQLQVFRHNAHARRLYRDLGYETVSELLSKVLDGNGTKRPSNDLPTGVRDQAIGDPVTGGNHGSFRQ